MFVRLSWSEVDNVSFAKLMFLFFNNISPVSFTPCKNILINAVKGTSKSGMIIKDATIGETRPTKGR